MSGLAAAISGGRSFRFGSLLPQPVRPPTASAASRAATTPAVRWRRPTARSRRLATRGREATARPWWVVAGEHLGDLHRYSERVTEPDHPPLSPEVVDALPGDRFSLATEAPLARGALVVAMVGVVFGFTFLPQLLGLALAGTVAGTRRAGRASLRLARHRAQPRLHHRLGHRPRAAGQLVGQDPYGVVASPLAHRPSGSPRGCRCCRSRRRGGRPAPLVFHRPVTSSSPQSRNSGSPQERVTHQGVGVPSSAPSRRLR